MELVDEPHRVAAYPRARGVAQRPCVAAGDQHLFRLQPLRKPSQVRQ